MADALILRTGRYTRPDSSQRDEFHLWRDQSFSARNFSSFSASALKRRMPSAVFSVAIASSFISQRNDFSSTLIREISALADASGLSLRTTGAVDFFNSPSNAGLMVSKSHPASSRISPAFRKL